MSEFRDAKIVELRVYDDPQNPSSSTYNVALPMTTLKAVVDEDTGESLHEILDEGITVNLSGDVTGSATSTGGNVDIVTTIGSPIPIAKGGTGATTAAGARNALGLGNTDGALPVANGGTGATTAAAAREALGIESGGMSLSTNVTTTASTQATFTPTLEDTFGVYAVLPSVTAGLTAGTRAIQNLLQELVNKSHGHGKATFNCNCTCNCGTCA